MTAQDAFKRSVAIGGIADTELQAADQINQELQAAATGTAPTPWPLFNRIAIYDADGQTVCSFRQMESDGPVDLRFGAE